MSPGQEFEESVHLASLGDKILGQRLFVEDGFEEASGAPVDVASKFERLIEGLCQLFGDPSTLGARFLPVDQQLIVLP